MDCVSCPLGHQPPPPGALWISLFLTPRPAARVVDAQGQAGYQSHWERLMMCWLRSKGEVEGGGERGKDPFLPKDDLFSIFKPCSGPVESFF